MAEAPEAVDWAALDALDDAAIENAVADDPDAAPLMDDRTEAAVLAQRARKAAGLSQAALAEAINVPVATLRDWEQGRHSPRGPGLALLRLIRDAPEQTVARLRQAQGAN